MAAAFGGLRKNVVDPFVGAVRPEIGDTVGKERRSKGRGAEKAPKQDARLGSLLESLQAAFRPKASEDTSGDEGDETDEDFDEELPTMLPPCGLLADVSPYAPKEAASSNARPRRSEETPLGSRRPPATPAVVSSSATGNTVKVDLDGFASGGAVNTNNTIAANTTLNSGSSTIAGTVPVDYASTSPGSISVNYTPAGGSVTA